MLKSQLLQASSQSSRRERCSSHSDCKSQVKALGGKRAQVTATASVKTRLSGGKTAQLLQVSSQGSRKEKCSSHSYRSCHVKALGGKRAQVTASVGGKSAQVTATASVKSRLSEDKLLSYCKCQVKSKLSEGEVLKSQLPQLSSQSSRRER